MNDPLHRPDSEIDKALGQDWPRKGYSTTGDIIEPTDAEIDRLSATLKPCPFCGSLCRLTWTGVPDFRRDAPRNAIASIAWQVECTSVGSRCPMGKHWLCSTKDAAIKAWNERVPRPAGLGEPIWDARNSEEPQKLQ